MKLRLDLHKVGRLLHLAKMSAVHPRKRRKETIFAIGYEGWSHRSDWGMSQYEIHRSLGTHLPVRFLHASFEWS